MVQCILVNITLAYGKWIMFLLCSKNLFFVCVIITAILFKQTTNQDNMYFKCSYKSDYLCLVPFWSNILTTSSSKALHNRALSLLFLIGPLFIVLSGFHILGKKKNNNNGTLGLLSANKQTRQTTVTFSSDMLRFKLFDMVYNKVTK